MHQQQYTEERGLLGKLCPGDKKLEGKNFYLDNVKKRATALLLEAISLLGGKIESFLHKDVNFVVTGSQEGLQEERSVVTNGRAKGTNEETQHPNSKRSQSVLSSEKQPPGTPRPMACGSRGKALLEKAIRNNERLKRSSVLASARSWGVKILFVDDVVLYLKQLTRESFSVKHKKPERTYTKPQGSHVVKAAALRSPYLKIEDSSRKYKPLHIQSMIFPSLCYLGRFSPFESPPPLFGNQTEESKTREKKKVESSIQDKSQTPLNCNPAPWRPRKKETSYCECCHQPFTNLEEHLQSDQHRMFVLDPSNYSVVDQLVAEMLPGFNPSPPEQSEETEPPSLQLIQDVCELEPLTDGETERAIQALRKQSLSFDTNISGLPSLGVQFPIANPATPPVDIQSPTPTECQLPDIQLHALSPAMPLLDVEPQAHASPSQQPPPCPDTPSPSLDPYSLPPVLSPQIPSCIMELHSSYSEPPVLSPQQYIAEETMEVSEMDTAESLSESVSVPIAISRLPAAPETNAEVKGDDRFALSGILFSSSDKLASCRSLPRLSATTPNPKKRCRSVSPKCRRSKRSKITRKCNWTEQGHESIKPERDIMAKCGGYSLFDNASCQITQCPQQHVSSTCTVETRDLTTICFSTVQNLPWEPSQTDILGHDNASVTTPSKPKTFEPQLQPPYEKSHSAFSSQDSQRSLSHSTSVCIESALIPDFAALSPSSSDSDWDCDLLSRLGPTSATPLLPSEQSCELDKELLHKP
nr:PREDICTED: histone-lysine N-methyltransferase 2D-like [Paralichthys olivaceus]